MSTSHPSKPSEDKTSLGQASLLSWLWQINQLVKLYLLCFLVRFYARSQESSQTSGVELIDISFQTHPIMYFYD